MPRHQHEAVVLKTANYTATLADKTISCDGTFTITLPTAVGCGGREYMIKNTGTGTVTIDANGTQTIDGELTQAITQYDCIVLLSNGSNWSIV